MNDVTIQADAVQWDQAAADTLAGALNDLDINELEYQVKNGATLFRVSRENNLVGFYILRIDAMQSHNEAVIVAAAGKSADVDLTALLVPLIEQQAINCKFMRIHTSRSGLIKKLVNIGYEPQEFILRKRLNHGK